MGGADEEMAYDRGKKVAFTLILSECVRYLGYDDSEARRAAWILERVAAIAALRHLCGIVGDNDWPDELHLQDIIEKHLVKHLA